MLGRRPEANASVAGSTGGTERIPLAEEVGVRAQPDQLDHIRHKAINQQKVRLHMAFPMVGPISDQAVIPAPRWKRPAILETGQNFLQVSFKRCPTFPLQGVAEVAFERI